MINLKTLTAVAAMALALPASAQEGGRLDKIAESGTINIGYRETSVPFSYLDENQKPIGYSIDLCMKIVDAVQEKIGSDVEINYVPVNPKTRIALMANGTIDLECGSTTDTLTREEQVGYLPVTFVTGTKLLVRADGGIETVEDLEGKAIALAQGTTNERVIKELVEEKGLDVDILPVRDHAEGMLSLETDRVDAYSTDHILLYGLKQKSKNPDDFAVVGDFLSFDPYAIMVPKGDADFALVGRKALASVFRSGEIHDIYEKWFGPMGVEMTPLLEAAFKLGALPE